MFQCNFLSVINYPLTNISQVYNNLINYNFEDIAIKMEAGLNGIVYFMGLECSPLGSNKTPPCSGPYPGYEILIYDENGKNVIAKTETNDKGEYFISLNPGNYIIYSPEGLSNKSNLVIIRENEITKKDLIIDKGIR